MKKWNGKEAWNAFLHWKFWSAAASGCARAWRGCIAWPGWEKLFCLPFPLVLLLSAVCGVGLVWVFTQGLEQQLPGYCLYPLSAYSLMALCVKLPGGIRGAKAWLQRHPRLENFLQDQERKFQLGLYFEQLLNFAYGCFKIVSGVIYGSAWIGADGIYNLTQALIQLFQILGRKRAVTLAQQWRSYRFCGVLILLMHLTLTGIVFQMVNWNRAEEQGQIMVIATAAFAFYKLTNSFLDIAKDRKHRHPVDSSIRMLNLAQAMFAMFSLQASMFHAYGTGASWEHRMNMISGCAVCLLIVSMGIYMIRRGSREMKQIQETHHGA